MGALLKHVNGAFRKLWFSGTHWTLSEAALSHPSHPHIRTQNLNVVRDGNSGGFASNATPRKRTAWGRWLCDCWRRLNNGSSLTSEVCRGPRGVEATHINLHQHRSDTLRILCACKYGKGVFLSSFHGINIQKTASVYRGSNYQQLIRGLCRVCVNSVGSEGCPAVSVTSPVVLFTQTQSSETVDRGAL